MKIETFQKLKTGALNRMTRLNERARKERRELTESELNDYASQRELAEILNADIAAALGATLSVAGDQPLAGLGRSPFEVDFSRDPDAPFLYRPLAPSTKLLASPSAGDFSSDPDAPFLHRTR